MVLVGVTTTAVTPGHPAAGGNDLQSGAAVTAGPPGHPAAGGNVLQFGAVVTAGPPGHPAGGGNVLQFGAAVNRGHDRCACVDHVLNGRVREQCGDEEV